MYIFNTCLDFQSWFFDIYVYTHFAPFVSNIFTSKSVLTIAETHLVTHPPSRTPKNITTCHETHYIAWSIFSHFLPKKLMILRSFSSLLRWESVPGTLLVKKAWDHRTIGRFLDGSFLPRNKNDNTNQKIELWEKLGEFIEGEILRSPVCHTWHKMHKSCYIPAK